MTMAHHLHLLLSVAAAAALLAPRAAQGQSQQYPWLACGTAGNFTARSNYLANLDLVAATLPGNASASPGLFATAADVGAAPDRVSVLALCRGDSNATACLGCLAQAFRDLPNLCAYNKDATIFYESCQLHYSGNASFLSGAGAAADDFNQTLQYARPFRQNVTSAEAARFNAVVAALVNATADYAAFNSTRRYASGEAGFGGEDVSAVYSWAQCTPDLTPASCRRCLARIAAQTIPSFADRMGGKALGIRCSYQYQPTPFLGGPVAVRLPSSSAPAPAPAAVAPTANFTPAPAPAAGRPTVNDTPAAEAGGGTKYSVPGMVLIILLPTIATINLAAFACLCFYRRRRPVTEIKQTYASYATEEQDVEQIDSMLIDISTLRAATRDFAESNKLGEGGFGAVYKGTLPDGEEIAVKRLSKSSTQGVEELKNELALVAKLQHKNLVRLIGVCLEQQERLLVYEFVPNRSLDQTLFDTERSEQLDWEKRFRIINGIARGLQYLHEDSQLKVVHRDLKASNILLDMSMNPKISDFGLARIFERDQTHGVTNRVVGTYGYMAPEYLLRGNYSIKSDAFSFGVMVLEIVTGRKNDDGYNSQQSEDLLTMVWEHWKAGTVSEIVDPCMKGNFSESDVLRCIHIGLLCIHGNPTERPVMSSVVMMLGSDTVSLQAPSRPVFYDRNGIANNGIASGLPIASLQELS